MMEQEPREPNARGERTRGWIVNASSMLGLIGHQNTSCYTPSKHTNYRKELTITNFDTEIAKHAVVGMTKQMALDYAQDRIHINALCPGFVDSPMISFFTADPEARAGLAAKHPWNALGRPEDVADAALFLASDEA